MTIRVVLALAAIVCGIIVIAGLADELDLWVGLGIILAALAAVVDR